MSYTRIIEWEDGYPTNESLERLWEAVIDHENSADCIRAELVECTAHCCASYSEEPETQRVMFSTGGWSGAEELIAIMLGRVWIRQRHLEWRRGGHYLFDLRP